MSKIKLCVHCKKRVASRPRDLCWFDYYAPGIRDLHPSKFANRGVGNGFHADTPLPAEPTDTEPGSDEKMLVLAERAARGESLFHPRDRQGSSYIPDRTPPLEFPVVVVHLDRKYFLD